MCPRTEKEVETYQGRTVYRIRRVHEPAPVVMSKPSREPWRGINPKRQKKLR